MTSKLDAKKRMKNINIPKFILHHVDDNVIPYSMGAKLSTEARIADHANTIFHTADFPSNQAHNDLSGLLNDSKEKLINFLHEHVNKDIKIPETKVFNQYSGVRDQFKYETPPRTFPGKIEIKYNPTAKKKFTVTILKKLPASKMNAMCKNLDYDLNSLKGYLFNKNIKFVIDVSDIKGPRSLALNNPKNNHFYLHGLLFDVKNKVGFNISNKEGRNSLLFSVLLQIMFNKDNIYFNGDITIIKNIKEKYYMINLYKKLFSLFETEMKKQELIQDMEKLERTVLKTDIDTPTGKDLHSYSDFLTLNTFNDKNIKSLNKAIGSFLETQQYS